MSCCASVWYCTPDGPVEVPPDGDGMYYPPAGWTSGPYPTEATAAAACPLEEWPIECVEGVEQTVPRRVVITFANKTAYGEAILGETNSVTILIDSPPAGGGAINSYSSNRFLDPYGCSWEAGITIVCQLFGVCVGTGIGVNISRLWDRPGSTPCIPPHLVFVNQSPPWDVTPDGLVKDATAPGSILPVGPELMGTLVFEPDFYNEPLCDFYISSYT